MSLAPISEEQTDILLKISAGNNVKVDAVAGSGKTTTCLYIAKNNPTRKILLLTYNAKLKLETRERARSLGLDNLEVHSYHAFTVKYLYSKGFKDSGILKFLKLKKKEPIRPFLFNLVIIDEAQDMNPTYYETSLYILSQLSSPQIIVMGDRKQSIYQFNKADSRFLTMAENIFSSKLQWSNASLSTSYRITTNMANFINRCCNGALPIKAKKTGPLPRYIIFNGFTNRSYYELKYYLDKGYKYGDIFILAASVKSERSPVRILANRLTEDKIPIYVPTSDEEHLDEDILNGKIVFSSFHQVKGLERAVVIIFGFDSSYFEYFARDVPDYEHNLIPNTLYVAITRAKECLSLLHDETNDYLPFLVRDRLQIYSEMSISQQFLSNSTKNKVVKKDDYIKKALKETAVTDLIKFIPVDITEECVSMLEINVEQLDTSGQTRKLDIPLKTRQDDLYEGVCEITGSAIPNYFELISTHKMTVVQHIMNETMLKIRSQILGKKVCLIDNDNNDDDETLDTRWISQFEKIETGNIDGISRLLRLTTEWVCLKSGYNFKKEQIKEYDWLKPETLKKATDRLGKLFTDPSILQFEKHLVVPYDELAIIGFMDIYDPDKKNIWELKVVCEIDSAHYLQVALYRWLASRSGLVVNNSYLFNIMNNKLYTINATQTDLDKIVSILTEYKKIGIKRQSDTIFLEECSTILAKYN